MSDWSFYDRGFSLFPLTPRTKRPAVDWEPYQLARPAPALVDTWRANHWNTGVATGAVSGVIVLDADSALARAEAERRGLPITLTIATPRGTHWYFSHPGWDVRNRAGRGWTIAPGDLNDPGVDGWDLRGDGGYVVGPGSHYVPTADELAKGKVEGWYSIELDAPIADAPDWLLALTFPRVHKPNVPARVADVTTGYGRAALNAEMAVLRAARDGELNNQINASAFAIGQLVGGGEVTSEDGWGALQDALGALNVADEEKSQGTLERGWAAGMLVPRAVGPKTSLTPDQVLGTRTEIPAPPPPIEVSLSGPDGSPRILALTQLELDDKQNHLAAEYWFRAAGYGAAFDEFAERILLNNEPLTDNTERRAWLAVRELSGLKVPKELFGDMLRDVAWNNRFHPLRIWLDDNQPSWDGVARLDNWLTTYLGVASSPYVQAIGSIFLVAAVRRARRPGCKFDELMVLEGPQGIEKSSAVAALCPVRAWFSEDFTVSMGSRELLEATHGKWLVEAPELSKLNTSEVEHVKHLLSRQWDRARMAYERTPIERGRQWVGFATVNADQYLSDPTGNRRFWPVRCGAVDLAAIERDRGQIWAEAAQREVAGESIRLPRHLWEVAAIEQDQRVFVDPLTEVLASALAPFESGRIKSEDIWQILAIPIDRRQASGRRVGDAMKRLGWLRRRVKENGSLFYAYFKGVEIPEIFVDPGTRKFIVDRPKLSVV